jgi:lipopolysaccharide export system protein LptA
MPQAKQSQRRNSTSAVAHGGSFLPRAAKTLLTAGALLALFGAYHAATMSLRVQPAKTRRHSAAQANVRTPSLDQSARMAQQFLPKYPWAATAKTDGRMVDGSTYYYFQEWKQESDKVVRFHPFAMVSKRKDSKPGDRPYTVVSDAAYITFASKFSLLGGNPGAIVRAELEGAVEIEGPNNLKIEGRNFYFQKGDPNVIYSDDRLSFWADHHSGKAKGMQLELLRDEKAKPDEAISIGGISSVKLLQDVDMTLVTDSFEQTAAPGAPRKANRPQAVRCQSVGSFNFILAKHEATFERNVRIRRETAPGKFDSISADDSVKIVFEAKSPKSGSALGAPTVVAQAPAPTSPAKPGGPPANAGDRPAGTFDPNLSFKEIHAHGKEVRLVSDANDLKALMHDLDYDRTARQAKLSAAPNRVQILHHDDRLSAPVIQLDHDESGQQIVQVWCRGEGNMKHTDEKTREVDLAADWKKEMHKYPDPKSSFDLVDLEEAMIEQPKDASGIAADHIRLWIVRQNAEQRTARPNLPPAAKRPQGGPQLDHMVAWQETEKVAMVSRQLEAESKRLEIWFEDGALGPPKSEEQRPQLRANLMPTSKWLGDTQPASVRPAVVQLADSQPAEAQLLEAAPSPAAAATSPAASPTKTTAAAAEGKPSTGILSGSLLPGNADSTEPYVMKADTIYVRVLRGGPGVPAQVANMISKGNVQLTQAQKNKAEPLVVEGNELEVQNRGPMDQVMVVLGQPAHVRNQGAHIEGSHIIFDRVRNTADVDGAGRLQLPVKQSAEPGRSERAMPFDVAWQNKMHFDGKTSTFLGSVRSKMDDGQEKTEVRCRQMAVTLTKPFSFTQEHKSEEQAEVQTIDCYGGVEFDSDSTLEDKLMEVRRGAFAQLHFDKPSGKSQAYGPGLLRVWRHNENGQSGLSQFANVQSNSPPKSRKKSGWEYMQVMFAGRMDGDFTQMMSQPAAPPRPRPKSRPTGASSSILGANGAWTMVFHDHVDVIYGPVDQPMEGVSRDYLIDQAGWLGCKILTIQQHPQSETKDQFVTMLATGNSQIEGKDFFGEAETISYDGSKTLYVLRGDGNRDARLTRQLKVGGDSSKTESNQILFKPNEHWMHQDQTKNLDWTQ